MKNLKNVTLTSVIMVLCLMITSCEDPFNSNISGSNTLPRNNNTNFTVSLSARQTNSFPINYDPLTIKVEIKGESIHNTSPGVVLNASHLFYPEENNVEEDDHKQFAGQFFLLFNSGSTLYGTYTGEEFPSSSVVKQFYFIEGGTGKYENVSGSLTVEIMNYNSSNPFTMIISGYIDTGVPEIN